MPALRELQAMLTRAILEEDATGVADAIVADGLPPSSRIQVYRNHVLTSLTEALATTYPVVCRLVDRRFFDFAADRYIRRHPPVGPCLAEYGAELGDFLGSFPPCAGHPYLRDVARLEWAMNRALLADDVSAFEPAALGGVPPDDVGRVVLRTEPSASWLESPWPVDRIWQANQPTSDPGAVVDLTAGPARLEIRRQGDVVVFRGLEPGEFAFRAALGAGETLATAADCARAENPGFELTAALRAVLGEVLVTGFTVQAGEPSSSG
jgi:hypothetical protein